MFKDGAVPMELQVMLSVASYLKKFNIAFLSLDSFVFGSVWRLKNGFCSKKN